jgi:hypothetical protein
VRLSQRLWTGKARLRRSPGYPHGCATFVFAEAGTHAGYLAARFAVQSPVQAGFLDGTFAAHRFRLLELGQSEIGRAEREEQLAVFAPAGA